MAKLITVASRNPVKLQAALQGFRRMFPDETFDVQGVEIQSGVSIQPMSDAETYQGALNRAIQAAELVPNSDFAVGIEGGVEERAEELVAFAWIVISGSGRVGKGRTGAFVLPPKVAELVNQGIELGEADDRVFGRTNSKQENGAIGLLTGNVLDRAGLYEMGVILALVPFKNEQLYD